MTLEELNQKQQLGEHILDAFAVGSLGHKLNIPGSAELKVRAAALWESAIGTVPESGGWVAPESGSKTKAGIRIWNWLTQKAQKVAKASKGSTLGTTLKLASAAGVVAVSYGGYVWLSESDRQNARTMDAQKDLVARAIQLKDPALQKQALRAIGSIGGNPLGTLPWLAIIGGIAVVGIFFWKKKG
jgi:hypothetical protein